MHWTHHTSKRVLDLTVDVNVRWCLMNEEAVGVGTGDWQVSIANNLCDRKLLLERSGLNVSWRYLGVTLVKWMTAVRWCYYQRVVPHKIAKARWEKPGNTVGENSVVSLSHWTASRKALGGPSSIVFLISLLGSLDVYNSFKDSIAGPSLPASHPFCPSHLTLVRGIYHKQWTSGVRLLLANPTVVSSIATFFYLFPLGSGVPPRISSCFPCLFTLILSGLLLSPRFHFVMTIVVLRSTNWGFVGRTSIGRLRHAKTGLALFG